MSRESRPTPPKSTVPLPTLIARHRQSLLIGFIAAAVGVGIALLPMSGGGPQSAMIALGITAFTVILWATIAVPQPYSALGFLALVILTGTASLKATMSGFLSSSLWLVLGGLLIGTAAEKTGFGRFVARRAVGSFRGSYRALVGGVLAGSTLLAFLIPATMGRIAITVPVVIALAREAGYETGSNGYVGLVVAAVIGNFMIALAILPGNLLNIMVVGSGETLYGMQISYMKYLLLNGPVLGLVKGLICWWAIPWAYPASPPQFEASASETERLGADAGKVGLILGGAILLWSTDFWHGLNPGLVALLAGIVCMVPGVGPLSIAEGLDPRKLLILIWVGTVLSLGAVLAEAGASQLVSGALAKVAQIEGASPLYAYVALVLLAAALAILSTIGGAIPIVTTAVGGFSAATGLPIETGVLAVIVGMSALAFPYIAAPIMVGLAMGKVSAGAATRFTLVSSALTLLIVMPLNALWWRLIGALP